MKILRLKKLILHFISLVNMIYVYMSHVHEHVFSDPGVRPMYALVNTQNLSMNWTLERCEPERIIVIRQYYPNNNYREIIKPFSCANFTRHFDNEAGIYDEAQKNFSGFVVARSGKMLSLVFRNITKEEEGPYELEIQRQEQYPKRPLMVLEGKYLTYIYITMVEKIPGFLNID